MNWQWEKQSITTNETESCIVILNVQTQAFRENVFLLHFTVTNAVQRERQQIIPSIKLCWPYTFASSWRTPNFRTSCLSSCLFLRLSWKEVARRSILETESSIVPLIIKRFSRPFIASPSFLQEHTYFVWFLSTRSDFWK